MIHGEQLGVVCWTVREGGKENRANCSLKKEWLNGGKHDPAWHIVEPWAVFVSPNVARPSRGQSGERRPNSGGPTGHRQPPRRGQEGSLGVRHRAYCCTETATAWLSLTTLWGRNSYCPFYSWGNWAQRDWWPQNTWVRSSRAVPLTETCQVPEAVLRATVTTGSGFPSRLSGSTQGVWG